MPIDYKEYHPDWKAISLRIRKERAGDKCEQCGVENGSVGRRGINDKWYTERQINSMKSDDGEFLFGHYKDPYKVIKIVLTVAHLDHNKANNDDANLKALCQRCHLHHDRDLHKNSRKATLARKRGQSQLDLEP